MEKSALHGLLVVAGVFSLLVAGVLTILGSWFIKQCSRDVIDYFAWNKYNRAGELLLATAAGLIVFGMSILFFARYR